MRSSTALQVICGAGVASALVAPQSISSKNNPFSAQPTKEDDIPSFEPVPLSIAHQEAKDDPSTNMSLLSSVPLVETRDWDNSTHVEDRDLTARATCSNPSVRTEWRSYSSANRLAFTNAIVCLINKPASGNFSPAKNRWEDLVRVHQMYTPNIHSNDKFLLWHRYFVWTLEQILRSECGFNAPMPWWDETLDAGNFKGSSIFTSSYFGTLASASGGSGTCVNNGKFAGLTLNIGPGSSNTKHCLSRAVDESLTAQCNKNYVNTCNARASFSDMSSCSEYGPHAYGHNGVGSIMSDVYASPGDPVFWLHHLFIDRNFRIWQNAKASRRTSVSGCADGKSPCTPLTMNTNIHVGGLRPDVKVSQVLDTMNGAMCYRYNY